MLSGNIEIINLIIKQGAKLNYDEDFDLGKPSPLDLAILKGDPNIVELLIKSGTQTLLTITMLKLIEYYLVGANVNCSSPIIGSPLHVACAEGISNRYDIMKVILVQILLFFGFIFGLLFRCCYKLVPILI